MNPPAADRPHDVYGVGNALVDILAHVEDALIGQLGLHRGSMTLMDARAQAQVLGHLDLNSLQLASGGSAANTMVAVAQSGGSGVYAGKVAGDTHGEFYIRDMQNAGIRFPVPPASEQGLPTGTCVVLTTPDAERTMCTHLGVSTSLTPDDIVAEQMKGCRISYVEGYLWDAPLPRAACQKAFDLSRQLGLKTAFTFSDAFLLDRYSDDFRRLISDCCDILFCNADEARRFCRKESLPDCARELGAEAELVFITDGPRGCHVVERSVIAEVDGFAVNAIDTVGAGDAFAGGVLYGLSRGHRAIAAARWGNYLASQVVATVGPRLPAECVPKLKPMLV